MSLNINNLPEKSGVYFFKDSKNTIIYIGKAKSLKKRVSQYFIKNDNFKVIIMRSNIKYIEFIITETEEEAFLLENTLIKRFMPKYNISLKDDKTYPYLKITNNNCYPIVSITRKIENDNSDYFGPYVDVRSLKNIIDLINKLFLLCKCRNKKIKKPCLNFFMNKCVGPFANVDDLNFIDDIISFVKFEHDKLIKKWEEEIKILIIEEKFEKAMIIKKKIETLNKLKNFDVKIWEIKKEDIERLKKIYDSKENEMANLENILDIPYKIKTIAGFDISNISGKYAVGSRVVFTDGKPNKAKYRKYRIKFADDGPNDFAMMSELIERTLNAEDINEIDLFLIDGGKGQLSSANQIIKRHKKNIPIISIAKKQETIFLPNQKNGIQLSLDSEVLKLIRYIRDEAHRFAVTYHKKIRNKKMLEIYNNQDKKF